MESFVADDGEPLRLHIAGGGLPLILLHGWTSSPEVWASMRTDLALRHQVFCPEARGHGSEVPRATQTPDLARLARDVLNLMDHFALERAVVAGHSMGALTLWQFIRDYGCGRLSHLCIIDQSPKLVTDAGWSHGIYGDFDAAHSQRVVDDLETDFVEAVLRLNAFGLNVRMRQTYERDSRGWQQARGELRKLFPGPLIAIWKSLVAADFREMLTRIDIPTLLVWGAQSNFYTLETARFLLQNIPSARLENYEGADHFPQLHQPERFARELTAFVAVER